MARLSLQEAREELIRVGFIAKTEGSRTYILENKDAEECFCFPNRELVKSVKQYLTDGDDTNLFSHGDLVKTPKFHEPVPRVSVTNIAEYLLEHNILLGRRKVPGYKLNAEGNVIECERYEYVFHSLPYTGMVYESEYKLTADQLKRVCAFQTDRGIELRTPNSRQVPDSTGVWCDKFPEKEDLPYWWSEDSNGIPQINICKPKTQYGWWLKSRDEDRTRRGVLVKFGLIAPCLKLNKPSTSKYERENYLIHEIEMSKFYDAQKEAQNKRDKELLEVASLLLQNGLTASDIESILNKPAFDISEDINLDNTDLDLIDSSVFDWL